MKRWNFAELVYGNASDVADILHGDNPPEDIAEIRAALTNALNRIATLEKQVISLRKDLNE